MQEAQEAQEAARRRALEENEMNAHPKEDGDVVPNNTMDVDDGTVSPGKKKKKERVLVERTGNMWCKECMSRKATCLVEEVRVKKWKQPAVEGTVLTCMPPGVVCTECASRKHTCFLPELEKERAMTKSASKQKREEDNELQPSGSKELGGAMVEGAEEVPKKRNRMQEPQAREKSVPQVREKKEGQGKIVEALEYIRKGLVALVRVVKDSNRHLAAIADYVGQCEWDSEDGESEEDEESMEECSGDNEVARRLGSGKK